MPQRLLSPHLAEKLAAWLRGGRASTKATRRASALLALQAEGATYASVARTTGLSERSVARLWRGARAALRGAARAGHSFLPALLRVVRAVRPRGLCSVDRFRLMARPGNPPRLRRFGLAIQLAAEGEAFAHVARVVSSETGITTSAATVWRWWKAVSEGAAHEVEEILRGVRHAHRVRARRDVVASRVRELLAWGLSTRAVARKLGLTQSRVVRVAAAHPR